MMETRLAAALEHLVGWKQAQELLRLVSLHLTMLGGFFFDRKTYIKIFINVFGNDYTEDIQNFLSQLKGFPVCSIATMRLLNVP